MMFPLAVIGAVTLAGIAIVILAWVASKFDQPRSPSLASAVLVTPIPTRSERRRARRRADRLGLSDRLGNDNGYRRRDAGRA